MDTSEQEEEVQNEESVEESSDDDSKEETKEEEEGDESKEEDTSMEEDTSQEDIEDDTEGDETVASDAEADDSITGKRERKKVDKFIPENNINQKQKKQDYDGEGTPLGEMAHIQKMLKAADTTELKVLHRVLFRTTGANLTVRKHLRVFNGFDFPRDEDNSDYKNFMKRLQACTTKVLKNIAGIVGLKKTVQRSELIENLAKFLHKPHPTAADELAEKKEKARLKKKEKNKKRKLRKGTFKKEGEE